jgi:hypothetical protein
MARQQPLLPSVERQRTPTERRPERTALYRAVHENLETFLDRAQGQDRAIPRFVERELRSYLECGLPAFGFVRLRCKRCGHERLLPFSCKGRGFCPSCVGRRMADTAAHLVDRVIPEVPVRQWVLSLPHPLRYRLAYDSGLCSRVLTLFIRTLFASLRRRARGQWREEAKQLHCGAVTFIQRSGDALNLNLHFHSLVLDGVYRVRSDSSPGFLPLPPPTDEDVMRLAGKLVRSLERLLVRRGFFEPQSPEADPLASEQPLLAALYDASVRGRVATGPRAGQRVQRFGDRIDVGDLPTLSGPRCAAVGGLSLHANVAVPPRDRKRLERLCRYVARPPLATERLSRLPDGKLVYRLRRRWRDGTTHVVFEPLELVEKLVALVPAPRAHSVRYHGVLAPAAAHRARVVRDRAETSPPAPVASSRAGEARTASPPPSSTGCDPPTSARACATAAASDVTRSSAAEDYAPRGATALGSPTPLRERRLSWAMLLRRVFRVDVLACPRCGGRMRILAAIDQPEVIEKILASLRLPARAPPPAEEADSIEFVGPGSSSTDL